MGLGKTLQAITLMWTLLKRVRGRCACCAGCVKM